MNARIQKWKTAKMRRELTEKNKKIMTLKIKQRWLFANLSKWGYERPTEQNLQIQHFTLEKLKVSGTIHTLCLWARVRWRVLKSFKTNGWTYTFICENAIACIFTQGNTQVPGIHALFPCENCYSWALVQGVSLYSNAAVIKQTTCSKHHHHISIRRQLWVFVQMHPECLSSEWWIRCLGTVVYLSTRLLLGEKGMVKGNTGQSGN